MTLRWVSEFLFCFCYKNETDNKHTPLVVHDCEVGPLEKEQEHLQADIMETTCELQLLSKRLLGILFAILSLVAYTC